MDLNGISSFHGNLNLPGLTTIEYAPVEWIADFEELVSDDNYLKQSITFQTGSWLKAPVFPIHQNWTEEAQGSQQGEYYTQRIGAIVPAMRPAVTGEFSLMKDRSFVLRLTDRNNQTWIIGTPEHGLLFKAIGKTGTAGNAELNDYQVQWSGLTANRAYGYDPVL